MLIISRLPSFIADVTNWFIENDENFLPNSQFPIIFDRITGSCKRSGRSFVNEEEAETVISYIESFSQIILKHGREISQNDIGVITPYSKQVQLIREKCLKKIFGNVMIGSAEVFQGQEKPIIIISTVRTDGTIGFVNDPRVRLKFEYSKSIYKFL